MFTGGSLLVAAVARTDLLAPEATERSPEPCGAPCTASSSTSPRSPRRHPRPARPRLLFVARSGPGPGGAGPSLPPDRLRQPGWRVGRGAAAWTAAILPLQQTAVADASAFTGRLLDVRQEREHADGHIPGVAHVELGQLATVAAGLGQVDAVMCGHGELAATAASLLERDDHPGVAVVIGGPDDWATVTGLPLASR